MNTANLSLKELRRLFKIFNAGQLCREDHPDDNTYDVVRFEDAVDKVFKHSGGWNDCKKKQPKLGDEYNVVWDLKDGGPPLTTTMDWDAIKQQWYDEKGGKKPVTKQVLFWRNLPEPPKIKKR